MKIHTFPDTGDAYNCTQCGTSNTGEDVTNGDLLVIESEQVVGICDTWPFAVTIAYGNLDALEDGVAVPDQMKKQFGPHILHAVGQAILRGWPVRPEFLALLPTAQQQGFILARRPEK